MTTSSFEFYDRRAREEAEAAKAATTVEAASAHRLLAIEYEAHAREMREAEQTRPKLILRSRS